MIKPKKYKLDLDGFKCPVPVLKISKKFKEIKKGDIIIVFTDDPKAEKDIDELSKNINLKILKKKHLDSDKMHFKLEKY